MPLTDNKNIILGDESDRTSVTPHTAQLIKDADATYLFYGDGTTVGGVAVDVRPSVTKTGTSPLSERTKVDWLSSIQVAT